MSDLPILQELRSDLYGAMVAATAGAGATRTRTRKRHRRLVLSLGGLAAALALAALLVLTSDVNRGGVTPAPATAAEALRQAAGAAEHHSAPVPRDDQYYFVHSIVSDLVMSIYPHGKVVTAVVTRERRLWSSIDRRGRIEERLIGSRFYTPANRRQRRDATGTGNNLLPAERHYYLGQFRLSRRQLLIYPTDPRTIYRRLLADVHGAGHSPNGEVFTEIGDALRESPAPARLRAGLYRALALIPHVQFLGQVKDRAGRSGIGVAFTEVGIRHELIFDPQTSEMLAERQVVVNAHAAHLRLPAGTVFEDSAYLRRAVTNELR